MNTYIRPIPHRVSTNPRNSNPCKSRTYCIACTLFVLWHIICVFKIPNPANTDSNNGTFNNILFKFKKKTINFSCEISSSHGGEYEAQNPLGCTAVFLIECRPTFQRYVLPPSSGRYTKKVGLYSDYRKRQLDCGITF
jgi:hypothetical protein